MELYDPNGGGRGGAGGRGGRKRRWRQEGEGLKRKRKKGKQYLHCGKKHPKMHSFCRERLRSEFGFYDLFMLEVGVLNISSSLMSINLFLILPHTL